MPTPSYSQTSSSASSFPRGLWSEVEALYSKSSWVACKLTYPNTKRYRARGCRTLNQEIWLLAQLVEWSWTHYSMSPNLARWSSGKEFACQCRRRKRHGFEPWVGKIPWRRKWESSPVFLPGKFHGHRSLADYNSLLSHSSRESLVLRFLPQGWYHLHIWGYWYFPQQSWFQLVLHPARNFSCTQHIS